MTIIITFVKDKDMTNNSKKNSKSGCSEGKKFFWGLLSGIIIGLITEAFGGYVDVIVHKIIQPRAEITVPEESTRVDDPIITKGEAKYISETNYLWLAVKINDLVWPKERIRLYKDNSWEQKIGHKSQIPGEKFDLILFTVDTKGDNIIAEWKKECEKTGNWPGKTESDFLVKKILSDVKNLYNEN